MGKLICLKFEEKNNNFCLFDFFSRENIVKLEKLDGGGNCGCSKSNCRYSSSAERIPVLLLVLFK